MAWTYQGTCKYCGDIKAVMADSQAAADVFVSRDCDCGLYVFSLKVESISKADSGRDLTLIGGMTTEVLMEVGRLIAIGSITKATIAIWDGSTVTIEQDKSSMKITREKKIKIEGSAYDEEDEEEENV